MAYLLDANVFMSASNLHYSFDFCSGFWEWLIKSHEAGTVFSIEKVEGEIQAGEDELSVWATERGPGFFLRPDEKVVSALATVSNWSRDQQQYDPGAISTFMSGADYYLVAHALAHDHTVVTHEVSSPSSIRKIKIPDACTGLGVKCIGPFKMLQHERAQFVLRGRT